MKKDQHIKAKRLPSVSTLLVILIIWGGVIALVNYHFSLWGRWRLSKYGLKVEESFGASSTMPAVTIKFHWNGKDWECPFIFGQIEDADFRFYDVDGDGTPDIVYGNALRKTNRNLDGWHFKVSVKNPSKATNLDRLSENVAPIAIGGTGLGLAIVKSCFEACGGTVAVRNVKPSSSQVEFELRLVQPQSAGRSWVVSTTT